MVTNLVGYLRRICQGAGLLEDTLLLGFKVVLVYLYKLEHRKKSLCWIWNWNWNWDWDWIWVFVWERSDLHGGFVRMEK